MFELNNQPTATENNRINVGEDDELELQGYCNCIWRTVLSWTLIIASCGLILIYFLARPAMKIRFMKKHCPLDKAQILLLKACI